MKRHAPLMTKWNRWKRRGRVGQTLVEYGLIISLISIVAVIVLQSLGTKVSGLYSTINSRIDQAKFLFLIRLARSHGGQDPFTGLARFVFGSAFPMKPVIVKTRCLTA